MVISFPPRANSFKIKLSWDQDKDFQEKTKLVLKALAFDQFGSL